jgi:hypothetical protein
MVLSQTSPDMSILEWVATGGMIPLLLGIIYGNVKGWWVSGAMYKTMEQDRDEWKALALDTIKTTGTAVRVAANGPSR